MKHRLLTLSLLAALLIGALTPAFAGRTQAATPAIATPHTRVAVLDKTRFIFHAGVAFFAVHHEYARYKAGDFASGAPHRVTRIVAAAAVLLLGYHEAKAAYDVAEKSHSKTLHALASPINLLASELSTVHSRFSKGQFNATDLQMLNNSTSTIDGAARANGTGTIKDVPATLPSGD